MLNGKIDELEDAVKRAEELSTEIQEEAVRRKERAQETIIERVEWDNVNEEHLKAFGDKPYYMIPKGRNEAWVIAPRFVPFQIGWLVKLKYL